MSKLTQIEALKKSDTEKLRQEVLEFIRLNPGMSRRDIAISLEREEYLSSITARVNELLNSGLLEERGSKKCPITGHRVSLLHPASGQKKPRPKHSAEAQKIFRLLKKIEKENREFNQQLIRVINQHFGSK